MSADFDKQMRRCVLITCIFFFLGFGVMRAYSQPGSALFDDVPRELRSSLVNRLSRLVKYSRSENFNRLYDLFLSSESKRTWVKRMRDESQLGSKIRLIDFRPFRVSSADEIESGAVMIEGCAEYKRKESRFSAKEIFVVIRHKGEWRFRYFGEPYDDGRCANEEKSSVLRR